MRTAARKIETHATEIGLSSLTSSQTAQYTQDLLDSLGKIALSQRQDMLARLLEAASMEAGRLVSSQAADTRLPG